MHATAKVKQFGDALFSPLPFVGQAARLPGLRSASEPLALRERKTPSGPLVAQAARVAQRPGDVLRLPAAVAPVEGHLGVVVRVGEGHVILFLVYDIVPPDDAGDQTEAPQCQGDVPLVAA